MEGTTLKPEREMVRRALVPGAIATVVAFIAGSLIGGPGVGASAAIGVVIAVGNFAAHGYTLAWAAGVSISMVQVVAMVGPFVRIGLIVGALFLFDTLSWFSMVAFALTLVPATLIMLTLEARLVMRGLGGQLQVPADPVAERAKQQLALREAQQA